MIKFHPQKQPNQVYSGQFRSHRRVTTSNLLDAFKPIFSKQIRLAFIRVTNLEAFQLLCNISLFYFANNITAHATL